MSANWGHHIELSLFGESHGKAIGITIGNLPAGIKLDMDAINKDMQRRAPGKNLMSTQRKEADEVEILSGVLDGLQQVHHYVELLKIHPSILKTILI